MIRKFEIFEILYRFGGIGLSAVWGDIFMMSMRLPQGIGWNVFGFNSMFRPPLNTHTMSQLQHTFGWGIFWLGAIRWGLSFFIDPKATVKLCSQNIKNTFPRLNFIYLYALCSYLLSLNFL